MRPMEVVVRAVIIALTVSTAIIHFRQAFLFLTPDILFVLNGIGYLTLLTALYLPIPQLSGYKKIIRFALICFTALTIVLWFVITGGYGTAIAYIDKIIEAVLIVMLVIDARFASRRA
jgi:hypothetical protein